MSKPVKLYLDEDTISRALINALRARNVDIVTAHEVNQVSVPDREHLEYAASLDRVVFTFNTRDFAKLHSEYLDEGRHHAGIIVSDQLQVGVVLRRLLKLLDGRSAEDRRDWLEFLGNYGR